MRILISLSLVGVVLLGGCGTAQKHTPHMGFGSFKIESEIARKDIVVLDRVEGTSSTTSILFGIVQVIDEDKLKLFWIPFFKEKYTYWKEAAGFVTTEDRAYYKALEKTPDADTVFYKSFDCETEGIPFICETRTVTFKGKGLKLRADE